MIAWFVGIGAAALRPALALVGLYLGAAIRWNHFAAVACLVGAAYFVFRD